MLSWQMTAFACALSLGCGGATATEPQADAGAPTESSFSCSVKGSIGHPTCTDWNWPSGTTSPTTPEQDCAQQGGVPVQACDRSSSNGGCLTTSTVNGVQVSSVVWYFGDKPEFVLSFCAQMKASFVSP